MIENIHNISAFVLVVCKYTYCIYRFPSPVMISIMSHESKPSINYFQ